MDRWLLRGGTAALLRATRFWDLGTVGVLGPWHCGCPVAGTITAVPSGWAQCGWQTKGQSWTLMELPLLSIPLSMCRLDTEERLALQADHSSAQPCRGEEGEAQMAADALISEND